MHDLVLGHQGDLMISDLVRYAEDLGLDSTRFRDYLRRHGGAARIAEDIDTRYRPTQQCPQICFRRHRGARRLCDRSR